MAFLITILPNAHAFTPSALRPMRIGYQKSDSPKKSLPFDNTRPISSIGRTGTVVRLSPPSMSTVASLPFALMISSLLRPKLKNLDVRSANGDVQLLSEASDAFVDAFWVGKGSKDYGRRNASPLSSAQRLSLQRTQFAEFRKRYAGVQRGEAELILCRASRDSLRKANPDELLIQRKDSPVSNLFQTSNRDLMIVGCAGIETTPIPKQGLKGPPSGIRAPLMSNLAVSRLARRQGIAQKLVQEAERICRYEWGYDDCYLYVEKKNVAAVKLYRKLGYREVWADKTATTLVPKESGALVTEPTTIVCMRKRLNRPEWVSRLLPF